MMTHAPPESEIQEDLSDEIVFHAEEPDQRNRKGDAWTVMIVDDDLEVHTITNTVFDGFCYDGKILTLVNASSAAEAKDKLKDHPETAVILLDVVMETDDAGLTLVRYIREDLKNHLVRIILRTGQPAHVPEKKVIAEYDINGYLTKSELTVQKLYSAMLTGLRSFRDLMIIEEKRCELEKLVAATTRFVPIEFLSFIGKKRLIDVELGDQVHHDMVVLVLDIRSFTRLSETMTPAENFEFVNSFLGHVSPVIRKHDGLIVKYMGDGIMAVFPDGAERAVNASIEIVGKIEGYNESRRQRGVAAIQIGIGIHAGAVMLGIVGEKERMQMDIFSDAVNLASRMEGLTSEYGVSIIVSEETLNRCLNKGGFQWRSLGKTKVKGRDRSISTFEVVRNN